MMWNEKHFEDLRKEQDRKAQFDYQKVIREAHLAAIERPRDPLEDLNKEC